MSFVVIGSGMMDFQELAYNKVPFVNPIDNHEVSVFDDLQKGIYTFQITDDCAM